MDVDTNIPHKDKLHVGGPGLLLFCLELLDVCHHSIDSVVYKEFGYNPTVSHQPEDVISGFVPVVIPYNCLSTYFLPSCMSLSPKSFSSCQCLADNPSSKPSRTFSPKILQQNYLPNFAYLFSPRSTLNLITVFIFRLMALLWTTAWHHSM